MSAKSAPRLAYYFACYPEPLALPGEGAHIVFLPEELIGYTTLDRLVLHRNDDEDGALELDPSLAGGLFVSLRFHRGVRPKSRILEAEEDLLRVIQQVAPALAPAEEADPDPDHEDPWSIYTVVEMATPLVVPDGDRWVPAAPSDAVMGPNLTRCIEALIKTVSAYRLSENLSIPPPARERLGPWILGATRSADPAIGAWDDSGRMVINAFATPGQHGLPPEPPADIADRISRFLWSQGLDHPMTAVQELQADARTNLEQWGDFRSAILLLHTASEVLLDTFLMSMLWEEGVQALDAARVFAASLVTRVRNQYHTRVGGNWALAGNQTVATWRDDLVLVRHQVAHGGFAPDRDVTEAAFAAHRNLRTHLLNRLVASLRQYPMTVGLLVGEPGLLRRGAITRRGRGALELATAERMYELISYRNAIIAARGNLEAGIAAT